MHKFVRVFSVVIIALITVVIFSFLKLEIKAIDVLLLYWIIDTNLKIPEK